MPTDLNLDTGQFVDIDPPTVPDPALAPPPRDDREELVGALADIATDAATSASTLPDDPYALRKAMVRLSNAAWSAVRRARGIRS